MTERRTDGEHEAPELTAGERGELEAWEPEEPGEDFVERVVAATGAGTRRVVGSADTAGLRDEPATRWFDFGGISARGRERARRNGALVAAFALSLAAAVIAWVATIGGQPPATNGTGIISTGPAGTAAARVVAATAADRRVDDELGAGVGGGGRVSTGEVFAVAPGAGTAAPAGAGGGTATDDSAATAAPIKGEFAPGEEGPCPGGTCRPRFVTGAAPATDADECARVRLAAAEAASRKLKKAGFASRKGSAAISAEGRRFLTERERVEKLYTKVAACGFAEGTVKAAFRLARAEEGFAETILAATLVDPACEADPELVCNYSDGDRFMIERLAGHVSEDIELAYVRVIELGRELHVENAWTRAAAVARKRIHAASREPGAGRTDGTAPVAAAPAPPRVLGPILPAELAHVVKAGLGSVKDCYEAALSDDDDLAGTVRLQFSVDTAGKVTSAAVIESSLDHPPAEECVAAVVRTWVFPARPGGEETHAIIPFSFTSR